MWRNMVYSSLSFAVLQWCCCPTLLPGWWLCCHVVAMVLECCCFFPVSMQLLCRCCGFAVCSWFVVFAVGENKQAHFDLYVTSAPVGHHAPLQPLVTGPHLHPSPASSPPSSSSPSTLPSSSQSSVTGPSRFSFSYPLFPYDFSFRKENAPSVSASILFCRFHSPYSAALRFVRLTLQLLPPSQCNSL